MNTSEVLNTAADLLEERGWTHGSRGWKVPGGPLCVEGALTIAALGTEPKGCSIATQQTPAYAALGQHIGVDKLWAWNDEWDIRTGRYIRTASEVIEVLRATALIEAAREDAALLAEIGRA